MSTTPEAELHDCAVCEKKTASVCSGCKTTFFCSREHQKLVYSTHKHLCSGPPDACYFPPLTADDCDALRGKEQSTFVSDGEGKERVTPLELFRRKGWWTGTFEDLLSDLSSESSPIEEPRRSRLLAHLTFFRGYTAGKSQRELYSDPWYNLGVFYRFVPLDSQWAEDLVPYDPTAPEDPFQSFNTVYRQFLIFSTILSRATRPSPSSELDHVLILAFQRLQGVVDGVKSLGVRGRSAPVATYYLVRQMVDEVKRG
ncbi:hypothetical protein JCM6882_003126 [Rhodosporidiobolus microsporus]